MHFIIPCPHLHSQSQIIAHFEELMSCTDHVVTHTRDKGADLSTITGLPSSFTRGASAGSRLGFPIGKGDRPVGPSNWSVYTLALAAYARLAKQSVTRCVEPGQLQPLAAAQCMTGLALLLYRGLYTDRATNTLWSGGHEGVQDVMSFVLHQLAHPSMPPESARLSGLLISEPGMALQP